MSFQYKALRGQLAKTHTRQGGATRDRRREGGAHAQLPWLRQGDVGTADDVDHVEEFLSSGVIYSLFLYFYF